MAESRTDQQQVFPLPQSYNSSNPTNYNGKRDEESASMDSDQELRRKKRMKYLAYFAAFVVFQTGIILIFTLTVMKVRTPKFRVRSANFESFEVGTDTNNIPSFNIRMEAELGVKNPNFGNYKFQNTSVDFFYGDSRVGQAVVRQTKAGWRSTKKLDVEVNVSSAGLPTNSQLGNDINSGVLTLNTKSKLNGKVELMFIFKKKKATDMDCTITISLADKAVREIRCK